MDIRILGPVEVWRQGRPISFARRQQRLILGILALDANRLVSRDRLIDLLWGDSPPAHASSSVKSRVSELRATLAQANISADEATLDPRRDGYVLQVNPERVDAHQFRQRAAGWRSAGSDHQARGVLRDALQLWRGPVFGGRLTTIASDLLVQPLESAHLTATEDLFEVELRLGRHFEVVEELLELSAGNRMRERLFGQMLLALHRTGRSAEALQAYDRWRRWLGENLGADPSSDIQALHLAILNNDPLPTDLIERAVVEPAAQVASDPPIDPDSFIAAVPRVLPPAASDFAGRQQERALLRSVLTEQSNDGARIIAVSGPAGVGKTALAVRVAHDLADAFPDGQLFVDLRGTDHDQPIEAFDVLGRFLRLLGVDGMAMPTTLDERIDLYRDLLAKCKILVVIDNAASDQQVLPLVPGNQSCAVIVTSRRRLGSTFNAYSINLNVLDAEHAADLLSFLAGAARIAAEPDESAHLARACGYLPLALRVAGAKLATKPHWSVGKLVKMLADEQKGLDHFIHDHLDVRASISLSYTSLPGSARRLLSSLGDLDLPDVTIWSAAALLDVPADIAETALEQLFDAQLLDVSGRDVAGYYPRYRIHDLVRLFAKERARDETAKELASARARAYSCCLMIVEAQYRSLNGGDYRNIRGATPRWSPGDDYVASLLAQPLRWFDTSRHMIAAIIRRAAADSQTGACWEIANTAASLFQMRLHFDELQDVLEVAQQATHQSDDLRGQAAILYRLAGNATDHGSHDRAFDLFQQAAALFQQANDLHGLAMMHALTAMIERFRGDKDAALRRYNDALPQLRWAGDIGSEAWVLRGIGQIYLDQDKLTDAESCFSKALSLYRSIGSEQCVSQVLFWNSMLQLKQGQTKDALHGFEEALRTCRALGDRPGEAQCLRGLGIAYQQVGDLDHAREVLLAALRVARQPRPTLLEGHIRRAIAALEPPTGQAD